MKERSNIYREENLEKAGQRRPEAPPEIVKRETVRETVREQVARENASERVSKEIFSDENRPAFELERINIRRPARRRTSYIRQRFFSNRNDIRDMFIAMEVLRPPVSLRRGTSDLAEG